jgi:hypothetical protein
MISYTCQRYYESGGDGSVQNVLQEGGGPRHTITWTIIVTKSQVQLLTELIAHLGPVHPLLMLPLDLPLAKCSCRW